MHQSCAGCKCSGLLIGDATTALIVYLISRLSEFSSRRAAVVCLAQAGVITFGFFAFLLPVHLACESSPGQFTALRIHTPAS